jgi:hypothetical protein
VSTEKVGKKDEKDENDFSGFLEALLVRQANGELKNPHFTQICRFSFSQFKGQRDVKYQTKSYSIRCLDTTHLQIIFLVRRSGQKINFETLFPWESFTCTKEKRFLD